MSQAGQINSAAGPVPPTVPTSFTTQSGTAVPAANVLIIDAFDSNENNDNGITVKGGVAAGNPPGTGLTNEVSVYLTNRVTGAVTTTNATPTTLVSLSLGATPGVYYVTGDIVAYDVTDAAGAAYSFSGAAQTDGVTATEIGSDEKDVFEAAAMLTADFNIGVTGNSAFLEVIGIAGKTIDWSALLTYRFIG